MTAQASQGLVSHRIASGGLRGTARAPGDKSISHRALMLGAVAQGMTEIDGLLEGLDVLATARALIALGADIAPPAVSGGVWRVTGGALKTPRSVLNLGNSGTAARLLMGLLTGYPATATLTGDESLQRRPMGRVIKPLSLMGAAFDMTSDGDRLPLRITGQTTPAACRYTLPLPSAQVKSAVLLAGLRAGGDTVVIEPVPVRDHTERMLRYFGAALSVEAQADGSNVITLAGGQDLKAVPVGVPADPSAAAFLAVAALIVPDSDIVIPRVGVNPTRTGIYDTLREMGGDISFDNRREMSGEPVADIRVRSSALRGVPVPPARVPSMIDEFPVLAVAAAFAQGRTQMHGLSELRVKESDRLAAIARGLAAAGVKVEAGRDDLAVTGGRVTGGCTVACGMDHRIGMSFLVMGAAAEQPVAIDDGATIATSFPRFAALMNELGADIRPV